MPSPTFVIFADPTAGWHIAAAGSGSAPIPLPQQTTDAPTGTPGPARAGDGVAQLPAPAPIAPFDAPPEVLAAALRGHGYVPGRPALLALPSAMCLCAGIPTTDLPARHRGQAMLYRLEERLPVSAEDVAADFIPAGPSALGVCVQRRVLQPLLDTLRAAGVNVRAVCPAALLALQQMLASAPRTPGNPAQTEMILWPDAGQLEVFVVGPDRLPRAWSVVPDDPHDVALHAAVYRLGGGDSPGRVVGHGVRPQVLDALRKHFPAEVVERPPASTHALASATVRLVLAGRLAPWVDFAHAHNGAGGLSSGRAVAQARGPLAWLAASAAVLAACLVVAVFWRAARYERLAAAYESRQRDVFSRAFPGQSPPRDVRSRLASEEQRLLAGVVISDAAAAGAGGRPPLPADGLLLLRDVISGLPADVRFRVAELRLDAGRFVLTGDARSHGDAEAIAEALRAAPPGFDVEPPRTDTRPGGQGVGFTVSGRQGAGGRQGYKVIRRQGDQAVGGRELQAGALPVPALVPQRAACFSPGRVLRLSPPHLVTLSPCLLVSFSPPPHGGAL